MSDTIQVVSPYRPFPPESIEHQNVGPFDWEAALRMLRASVTRACDCETHAITDVDTTLGVPTWRFRTHERRLMLWILEVSLKFLQSRHFDRDTVMISPDILIYHDLAPQFTGADLGIVIRDSEKFAVRPMLNGVQWWARAGRSRLITFYQHALAVARALPEDRIVWGADTDPFLSLLGPMTPGRHQRDGLSVEMWSAAGLMESLTSRSAMRLKAGLLIKPPQMPIVDFKYRRKHAMAAVFAATIGPVPEAE